jgi:hypothetical protein
MPKLDAKQAKTAKLDPLCAPFFNNMLGSCGELQPMGQRPFTDGDAKELGIDLSTLDRNTNFAPTAIIPRVFYEKLLEKFMKMPGQKGEHTTIASK